MSTSALRPIETTKVRRAAKQHDCFICHTNIEPRVQYLELTKTHRAPTSGQIQIVKSEVRRRHIDCPERKYETPASNLSMELAKRFGWPVLEFDDDPNTLRTGSEPAAGRKGDWMQTYTGLHFYPLDPRPDEICIEDIAHALSMVCRYGGHTLRFYSVAEHCWRMSHLVSPENALWALLHDASEAYVGDMVRPFKRHMPDYRRAEDEVQKAIAVKFGLSWPYPAEVTEADNRIVQDERKQMLKPTGVHWFVDDLKPFNAVIVGYSPAVIENMYLARFKELTK